MRQLVIAMTILLYTSIISHLSVNSHWIQKFNILRWGRNKGRRNVSSVSMQKRNHSTNDEKTFKAYGLQNLGNTCYLNSVLQGLYYCTSFRNAINTYTSQSKQRNSIQSLQDLFRSLSGDDEVGKSSPRELIMCLELNPNIQEDAQELYLKLINKLNDEERSDLSSSSIMDLFTGKFENYISCHDVNFTKTKIQKFRDLSLDITSSLHSSITKLLEPSILEVENMYKTEQFGRQVASKGSKIVQLPKILVCQVNRFSYDMNLGRRLKLSDKFEFPLTLHMTPYFNTTSVHVNKSKVDILADSVCIIYELKSVIIHTGTPEFGHYIALARPYPDIDPEKWLQLDDSRVTYITHQQMCDIAFGGGSYIVPGMPDNASTNAYMLLYEKK